VGTRSKGAATRAQTGILIAGSRLPMRHHEVGGRTEVSRPVPDFSGRHLTARSRSKQLHNQGQNEGLTRDISGRNRTPTCLPPARVGAGVTSEKARGRLPGQDTPSPLATRRRGRSGCAYCSVSLASWQAKREPRGRTKRRKRWCKAAWGQLAKLLPDLEACSIPIRIRTLPAKLSRMEAVLWLDEADAAALHALRQEERCSHVGTAADKQPHDERKEGKR
jgi:hypothetical protein